MGQAHEKVGDFSRKRYFGSGKSRISDDEKSRGPSIP
jgi:hypothetical protein